MKTTNNTRWVAGITAVRRTEYVFFSMTIPQYMIEMKMYEESEYNGWKMMVSHSVGRDMPHLRSLNVSGVFPTSDAFGKAIAMRKEIRETFKYFKPCNLPRKSQKQKRYQSSNQSSHLLLGLDTSAAFSF